MQFAEMLCKTSFCTRYDARRTTTRRRLWDSFALVSISLSWVRSVCLSVFFWLISIKELVVWLCLVIWCAARVQLSRYSSCPTVIASVTDWLHARALRTSDCVCDSHSTEHKQCVCRCDSINTAALRDWHARALSLSLSILLTLSRSARTRISKHAHKHERHYGIH